MSEDKKQQLKIAELPDSLENAYRMLEASDFAKETLGEHVFEKLIANKRIEWDAYRIHVGGYEIGEYLPFL